MKLLNLVFLLFITNKLHGQNLPVIKATSKEVKIIDGDIVKDNYWVIFPETKPDIYWVEFPKKDHKVTFITNQDSISFDVSYGNIYDFIILLNGKDSCFTRISATYPKDIKPINFLPSDTIPFTMKDNRIYIKGKLNGSRDINFQFDLGASGIGIVFVNHMSLKKVYLNFDKTTNLLNDQGANQTRLSSTNNIQLGKSIWQNIEVVETKNMEKCEDAMFGNGLFLNKYIEVDYDKSLLIIHSEMPIIDQGFSKHAIQLDQNTCPQIKVDFELEGKIYSDWFGFDTGNTGNGIVSNQFISKHGIYKKFSRIFSFGNRAIARMPKVYIGNHSFDEGIIILEKNKKATSTLKGGGIIGNKLLKKFNFILDTQKGFIYLKPNMNNENKSEEVRLLLIFLLSSLLLYFVYLKIKPKEFYSTTLSFRCL